MTKKLLEAKGLPGPNRSQVLFFTARFYYGISSGGRIVLFYVVLRPCCISLIMVEIPVRQELVNFFAVR